MPMIIFRDNIDVYPILVHYTANIGIIRVFCKSDLSLAVTVAQWVSEQIFTLRTYCVPSAQGLAHKS